MGFKTKALPSALFGMFGATLALVAAPASSQEGPQKLERIEVTGSNIKRTDTEGVNPVQTITRKEIERTGQATVAELLRSISANSGQSFNETFTNSFSQGASGIALRGLSQKNTLVLLNGRRVANYGFAQNLADTYVDLNAIPIGAVERIEVLKDGASAIYGSDAIAGVVNVILRKDYTGAEVGGSYGKSYEGGMAEKQASATVGFGNLSTDRFNILIAANWFRRDLTRFTDRAYINDQDYHRFGGLNQNLTGAGTYQRVGVTPNRVPFATCGATGFPGTVQPVSAFAPTTTTGSLCAYNPSPYSTLFPESTREQVVVGGTFDITPSLQAFADLTYSHNNTKTIATPTPFSSTSVAFDPATGGARRVPATLPVGNPANPFSTATNISYTFFDIGPRNSELTSKFYRAMVGLKGSIGKWDWETAYLHSESEEAQHDFNRVDSYVLANALATGTYNFLNPQLNNPALTNSLRINPTRRSLSKLDLVDAKTSTELMSLPAGPLGFAAGAEFKRESIADRPDFLITNGNVLGQGATLTDGSRNVTAAYAEFSVPIVKKVEASLAAREDHYSDFGSAFSPKIGAKWQPVPEFLVRATASKGFRAPSLPENSQSSAVSFVQVNDPRNPAQPGALVTISSVSKGNPGLIPERSKSYNAGFVFAPDPTTSVGIDLYSIEQKDVVRRDSPQFIVNNEATFPTLVLRDPVTGNLITVLRQYRNYAALRTLGYDLDFRKSLSLEALGKFTLAGTWTYLQRYKTQISEGGALLDFAGSNGFSAFPRARATTSLTWEYQAFTTQLTYYYTGAYAQTGAPAGTTQGRVGEYRQYDLYVAWEGVKNLKLYGSIQNLANTHPPFDVSATGGLPYDFTLYDARGRYFRAGLTYKFL